MKRWMMLVVLFLMAACEPDRDASVVLRVPFDQPPHLADASGNQQAVHSGRVVPTEGVRGAALMMDGRVDTVLEVQMSERLRETRQAITISLWAFRQVEGNVALVAHRYPSLFLGFHGPQFKWQLAFTGGGRAACYADPRHVAAQDRWYHIAATFNGYVARLYVDGEEICSDWTRGGEIDIRAESFTVGAYYDEEGKVIDLLRGKVDELAIYNRALSARQIRELAGER